MSKFRFILTPHPLRRWCWLLPAGALVLCILALHEAVWSYLQTWHTLVILLIGAGLYTRWHRAQPCPIQTFVLADDRGHWQQARQVDHLSDAPVWLLTPASRLTPIGMYLHFSTGADEVVAGRSHYCWILRGECTQTNYRRLARTIIHLSSKPCSLNSGLGILGSLSELSSTITHLKFIQLWHGPPGI